MNARYTLDELQIGIDVGSINHAIAIAKEDGTILQEFSSRHFSNSSNANIPKTKANCLSLVSE